MRSGEGWGGSGVAGSRACGPGLSRLPTRRKRSARAVIDGELVPLTQRVEVKIHPGGLRVLAPQALAEVLVRTQDVPDETGPALAG